MKLTPTKEACKAVLCVTEPELTEDEIDLIASYAETGKSYMSELAMAGFLQFQHAAADFALNPFLHSLHTTRRVNRGDIVIFAKELHLDYKLIDDLFEGDRDIDSLNFEERKVIIQLYSLMLDAGWHFAPICEYPNIKESSDARVPFECSVIQPLIELNEQLQGTIDEFNAIVSHELAMLFAGEVGIKDYLELCPETSVDDLYWEYRDALATLCCIADSNKAEEPTPITVSRVLEIAHGLEMHYNGLYQMFGLPYLPNGTPVMKTEVVFLFGFLRSLNMVLAGDVPSGATVLAGKGHDPFYHPFVEAFTVERNDSDDTDNVQE